MNNISNILKKRFIRDTGIPIQLYQEPYFSSRLLLFEDLFDTVNSWNTFVGEVTNNFRFDEDYLKYYNLIKDTIIDEIKAKPEYQEFINCDMSQYVVNNCGIGDHSIYTPKNNKKVVLSFDLKQANFQALKYFNPKLVNYYDTWEGLISNFTGFNHIINSKYIRQVIFGTLNPRRQVTIEKFLMRKVLEIILKRVDIVNVLTFMHDEIVLDISSMDSYLIANLINDIRNFSLEQNIKIKWEEFKIYNIPETDFYVKYFKNGNYDFKCVTSLFYPIVLKQFRRIPIEENDLVFYHEGLLCKFVDVPKYQF